MGVIKDIGTLFGNVAGAVIGVPINIVGEAMDSKFLQDVGEGIYNVSAHTGELLGNVAEGSVETIKGVVNDDNEMQLQGLNKIFDSGVTYVTGMATGVTKIAKDGIDTLDAIIEGDSDKAIKVGKEIVKTVAVGTLAIGVADVIDGIGDMDLDADDGWDEFANEEYIAEHPDMHHVTPYERVLADGTTIWVDGDGDTSVDTFDGWYQGNPTYKG